MIVYNLNFPSLKRETIDGIENVVTSVEYKIHAYSEENPECKYYSSGAYKFNTDNIELQNFVLFDDLNKDHIVNWIMSSENITDIVEWNDLKYPISNVQKQLDVLISNTVVQLDNWSITNSPITYDF
jgi:hypothetical protein